MGIEVLTIDSLGFSAVDQSSDFLILNLSRYLLLRFESSWKGRSLSLMHLSSLQGVLLLSFAVVSEAPPFDVFL